MSAEALQAKMLEGVRGDADIAVTVTLGENAENHHAMQTIGIWPELAKEVETRGYQFVRDEMEAGRAQA